MRRSWLEETLQLAADLLVGFDRYFRRPYWVVERVGLKSSSISSSLSRLRDRGVVDHQLNLSRRGKSLLSLVREPWDGYWRLVVYDIPENQRRFRQFIRRKLIELGFANIQKSTWLSPLPVDPWIKQLKKEIGRESRLFLAISRLVDSDPRKLVAEFWPINSWQKEAMKFLAKIGKKDKLSFADQRLFWQLVAKHPLVPLDLLPASWPLEKLAQTFVVKTK